MDSRLRGNDKKMLCDLIIKGKYVLPMDAELSVIKDGAVAVADGKIAAVGAAGEMASHQAKETIDAGNSIIMPGLINTHTHAAMAYLRGLADDLPFDVWLNQHILPAETKYVNEEFIKKSSELACLEMIKSGTTCFNDMYFFGAITAAKVKQAGLKAVIGDAIPNCVNAAETIDYTVKRLKVFKNDESIKIALAPHSVYVCSRNILEKIKQYAAEENLQVNIHVSESEKEIADCQIKYGKTPVAYLDEIGLLGEKTVAVHSIWLSDNDLKIYQDRGVKVAHCPVSNMKLSAGIAPLNKILKKGIIAGLGTDGAASNNTLDLLADMRVCALLHKAINFNPAVVSAPEVVQMATSQGAKVLGWEKEIGSLEIGKKADIITINLDKPHLSPIYDPYSHLVYCANGADVANVIVNGKVIMKNREVKTLDEEKTLAEAAEFKI